MKEKNRIAEFVRKPAVHILCQLLLGGLFIYASFGKILYPSSFTEAVENYRILPTLLVKPVALVLPWIELLIGLLLLLGFWKRLSATILTILLVVFIAALSYNLARGVNVNCGCIFQSQPDAAASSTDMILTILRDLFLLIPGIIIIFFPKRRDPKSSTD